TLPADELAALLSYFRQGGAANMTALVRRLAGLCGRNVVATQPVEVPKAGFYQPGIGLADGLASFFPFTGRISQQGGLKDGQEPPLI
ncbi:hypothetical protein, partial [Escherichia coli]|uniref:hypothetical protein n=1 Tax=Escherichia coli TaxID=562 RepID=UPI0013D0E611